MSRARALAIVVLLLSYGAVGARQPAVRTSGLLVAPARAIANAAGITVVDRSRLMLDVIRALFDAPDGQDAADTRRRQQVTAVLTAPRADSREAVPLPLDPSIWRETIFDRQIPDDGLVAAILSDRGAALLYHGLAALDDETLAALGPDRETLIVLKRHPGTFAAFGRSLRIHAGRVAVPGGPDADSLWQEIVGAEPTRPGAFARRLFGGNTGRLAFFFDTLAHLDPAHQRFALGGALRGSARVERVRALLDVFEQTAPEWRPDERPFNRPSFDPALTLSVLAVSAEGTLAPPAGRDFWTRVFRADEGHDPGFEEFTARDFLDANDRNPVDAAWLASRVHRQPAAVGRRRLESVLFAQRIHDAAAEDDAEAATAVRGYIAYPSLLLTLERMEIPPALMIRAARRAQSLDVVHDEHDRRNAIVQFQGTLALLDRIATNRGLSRGAIEDAVASLVGVEVSAEGYQARIARWLRDDLSPLLPGLGTEGPDPFDDALLAAMAGVSGERAAAPVVELEGHAYRADPAQGELMRLRRVRERQDAPPLEEAVGAVLAAFSAPADRAARVRAERVLADALASLVYAAYLGSPDGPALGAGNVALRHDLGMTAMLPPRPAGTWRLPVEEFGARGGWRLRGSLLGLDLALARLTLRRMDDGTMPPEPHLSKSDRQTAEWTAALLNPHLMTDAARDEIASAIARGRARLTALTVDRDEVDRVARDAGLSEWRREALAWAVAHEPEGVPAQLSLLELFWLGAPRQSEAAPLDPWGAALLPLTGCPCLRMPHPQPWEEFAGRPASGIMATRGADVMLLVAETLRERALPASLAPAVASFAMRDALDHTEPAYLDDWAAFSAAVTAIPRDRMDDYIAALAASGPLVPLPRSERRTPLP